MFVQGSHENASFFAESAGQQAKYSLLYAYRVGGPPTYIEDLCISGPSNYQASFHNLVGIRMENTNGFYFKGIWFTAYEAGCVLTAGECNSVHMCRLISRRLLHLAQALAREPLGRLLRRRVRGRI